MAPDVSPATAEAAGRADDTPSDGDGAARHHPRRSEVRLSHAVVSRRFRQVDVFTDRPYAATRSPWSSTPTASTRQRCRASPGGRTSPRRRSSSRRAHRRPTTGSASSRPPASCPSPGTRRSARVTPGWRPAASRPRADVIVQECAAGLVPVRRAGDRLAFAAPPLRALRAGRRRRSPTRWRPRSASSRRGRRRRSGWTTDRAGWRSCSRTWRRCAELDRPASARRQTTRRSRRDRTTGSAVRHRGAGVLPVGRDARRGSRDRQPQRVRGAVAARHRRVEAPYVAARAPRSGGRARSTSPPTPTARVGRRRHRHVRRGRDRGLTRRRQGPPWRRDQVCGPATPSALDHPHGLLGATAPRLPSPARRRRRGWPGCR